jgi:general secretion pathway protein I
MIESSIGMIRPLAKRGRRDFPVKEKGSKDYQFCACRKEGFTLLEVLIALAIVGGLLVTLIYTLNYHLSLAERQETITVATLLAKNKITEMEKVPEGKKGFFDEPYDNYSYETFVKESPYIGISEIVVTVKAGNEKVKLNEFVFK